MPEPEIDVSRMVRIVVPLIIIVTAILMDLLAVGLSHDASWMTQLSHP